MNYQEKTYYEILGIRKDANQSDIKKSYFFLALKYHPDRNPHLKDDDYKENEEKFKEIAHAFKTLYDPIERTKYDQLLDSKKEKKPFIFYSFYSEKNKKLHFTISSFLVNILNKLFTEEQIQTGKDFFTVLKNFIHFSQNDKYQQNISELAQNFKIFYQQKNIKRESKEDFKGTVKESQLKKCINDKSDIPTNNIEQYKKIKKDSSKMSNVSKSPLIYNVNVSLEDIYNNIQKELNVARLRKCHLCLGNGYLGYGVHMSLCHVCKGLMKLVDHKVFPIDINKKTIIFEEEGSENEKGELNDLIINIHPKPHNKFEIINDYDLIMNQKVNLMDFYSKINIQFKHLDSKEYLIKYYDTENSLNKILNTMEIIIPNLGLPIKENETIIERGSLIIKLHVILPELSIDDINKLNNIISKEMEMKDNKNNIEYDDIIKIKIVN